MRLANSMAPMERQRRALLLLAGLLLAIVAQDTLDKDQLLAGLALYAVGLPLVLIGVSGALEIPDRMLRRAEDGAPRRYRLAGVALSVAAVVAEIALLAFQELKWLHAGQTWPWYLACWGLFMAGLLLADARWKKPDWRALFWERRWEWLTLLLILGLAAAVRTYDLENTPMGLWGDEGNDGVESIRVLKGEIATPFTSDWGANPAMHQWVNALFFLLFGSNVVTLRLVAAVAGLCMIGLTYLLGRQWWGPRLGLLAAFFMAVSRWHIHRSRFDSVVVQGMPLQLLAFLFLFRALRTRRLSDFAWCGLAGGLGLNFYHGLRAAPIIIVLFLLYVAIPHPLQFVRRYGLGCVAAGIAALFAFAPLGQYYVHTPAALTGRAELVWIFNQETHFRSQFPDVEPTPLNIVKVQAAATALMFNYKGDVNEVFNWARKPMLDTLMSILFVLGLAYAVWRWRDWRHAFLLIWVAVTLILGSVLTVGTPHSVRTAGAIPAVMLLAGLGAERMGAGLWPALGRGGRRVLLAGAAIWLALMMFQNLDVYFRQYMPSDSVWYSRGGITTIVSRALKPLAQKYRFYFYWHHLAHRYHNVVNFVAGPFEARDFGSLSEVIPAREPTDKGVVYVFIEDDQALAPALQAWYPGGELAIYRDPKGQAVGATYRVEAEEILAHQGLVGRYYANAEWAGPPIVQRVDKQIAFSEAWKSAPIADGEFSVEWRGTLLGAGDTRWIGFISQEYGSLEIDGQKLVEGVGGGTAQVALARGLHSITVRARFRDGPARFLLVWGPTEKRLTPIESERLGVWPAAHGLLGVYYPNQEWNDPPAYYQIDPLLNFRWPRSIDPLSEPFSVEWRGTLRVDAEGDYTFATQIFGRAQLWIGDQLVLDQRDGNQDGTMTLQAGSHPLRLRYAHLGGERLLRVFWTPPDGEREIIPMEQLTPAFLEATEAPALLIEDAVPGRGELVEPTPWRLVGRWGGLGSGRGELNNPVKAAVLPDGRLAVTDRGNHRVVLFDAQGKAVEKWERPALTEPTDIEVSPAGEVYVLDSGRGVVETFDLQGQHLRTLGSDWGMYAPRAMRFGANGALYVVATGSNQVVIAPAEGQPARRFGAQGKGQGEFQQPVDLAIDSQGDLYVLDTMANKRVQHFNAAGVWRGEWPLTWAPASVAPGIAYHAADDSLYLMDPTGGQIYRYSLDGELQEKWGAPAFGATGEFFPISMTVDSKAGRFYLIEGRTHQVWVFTKDEE